MNVLMPITTMNCSFLVSHPNSKKNYKTFTSSMQEDLVPTTLGELITDDNIRRNDSKK